MKRLLVATCAAAATITAIYVAGWQPVVRLGAQAPQNAVVPKIPFDTSGDFLKYLSDMNLGEVLGVAVNSEGQIVVLNHPGSATSGPIYGNASTQLLQFDQTGKFVREIGKGVDRSRLRAQRALRQVRQPLGCRQRRQYRREVQPGLVRNAQPGPASRRARRSRRVLVPSRPWRPQCAAARAHRWPIPSTDRRCVGLGRQHLHQRRLYEFANRQVRQARELGDVVGFAR